MPPLSEIYDRLFQRFGPQHWWPAQTPFEVLVGAVLTQNTAWSNVARAMDNLRQANLLSPERLYRLPDAELEELIRPAGYFRLKARRLKNLLAVIVNQHGGSLDTFFDLPTETLRESLLQVNGVGPETADSILLYAAGRPRFVVDAYTHRVLKRHAWIEPEADYHAVQEFLESSLPTDAALYNEFHALLVRVGHEHCRRTPRCEGCPLVELLPPGGLSDWEA